MQNGWRGPCQWAGEWTLSADAWELVRRQEVDGGLAGGAPAVQREVRSEIVPQSCAQRSDLDDVLCHGRFFVRKPLWASWEPQAGFLAKKSAHGTDCRPDPSSDR